MCGGYFKSTSIGKLDASGRGLKGTVVIQIGPGEKKEDGCYPIRSRGCLIREIGLYRYDVSQMPRNDAG